MRMLYYNPTINEPAGAGSHGRGVAYALMEAGVELLAMPAPAGPNGSEKTVGRRLTGMPEVLKLPARDVRGRMRAIRGAQAAVRDVSAFSPDVAIIRRAPYDYVLQHVISAARCPVIAECNGVAAMELDAYYGQGTLPWERQSERHFYMSANACVAITDEVADQLGLVGVDPTRIKVIPNAVDTNAFRADGLTDSEVLEWRGEAPAVLGYCAKVSPLHDLCTVVRAAESVANQIPGVRFLFVGITKSDLTAAGAAPIVLDRSMAPGVVPHMRVAPMLRGADIFWAALSNSHGSPLKVFEYLALGRPVLFAAAGSGVRPIIDAHAGAVVGRADASGLAQAAIDRILNAPLRSAEGLRAREWTEARGGWERVAEELITMASQLL